jgi:hypothetical protein
MHAVQQAKNSQREQCPASCQHRGTPDLQRHGNPHAEEGQPINEKDKNEIEAQICVGQLLTYFIL